MRSGSAEPEAEHKDTCVLSCVFYLLIYLFVPVFEGTKSAGKMLRASMSFTWDALRRSGFSQRPLISLKQTSSPDLS